LAKEKGAFAKCRPELLLKAPVLQFVKEAAPELWKNIHAFGLRNSSLISIAPTGSISTMSGFSGGIEPLFRIYFQRTTHSMVREGKYFEVFARSIKDLMNARGMENTTVEELQKEFPYIVAAHDIDPVGRIRVQAAIQKYVDNAISSTVNMRCGATTEEVREVYRAAWKLGCKGVTVFVQGCKRTAIMV
jgi:ribonucleoside-diphosphate reductase alpha chain